jgi:hypothetical protein
MNALARFEGFMREIMDRRVVRLMGGTLQPVEMAREIGRCMDAEHQPSPSGPIAPDHFDLLLHPDDCADLRAADGQMEAKLGDYTLELARERGYNFNARPRVMLVVDPDMPRGEFRVRGQASAPRRAGSPWGASGPRSRFSYERPRAAQRIALELADGSKKPSTFMVDHFPYAIGRDASSDLVVPDPRVSRRHALIEQHDGRFRVRDLGSRNGTQLNGQPVDEADLTDGDRLTIGGFEAIVRTGR